MNMMGGTVHLGGTDMYFKMAGGTARQRGTDNEIKKGGWYGCIWVARPISSGGTARLPGTDSEITIGGGTVHLGGTAN